VGWNLRLGWLEVCQLMRERGRESWEGGELLRGRHIGLFVGG
jgi:hypothetical protein